MERMEEEERKEKGREDRRNDAMPYPVCSIQHTVGCPCMMRLVHSRLLLCGGFCENAL